jgi:hypothetical protein
MPDRSHLHAWAERIVGWGGKKVVVVALVRKPVGFLFAIMRILFATIQWVGYIEDLL